MPPLKNHTGEVINGFEITGLDDEYTTIYKTSIDKYKWLYKCLSCGRSGSSTYSNLKNKRCFCHEVKEQLEELHKSKLSRLSIESYAYSKNRHRYWNCICDCGKKKIVDTTSLITGSTASCGCLQINSNQEKAEKYLLKDLKGQKFGDWIVVQKEERPAGLKREGAYWKIKCLLCGEEKILAGTDIRRRKVMKCSKTPYSHSNGEIIIANLLTENHIIFEQEKKFPDLLSERGNYLRFDFAIYNENKQLQSLIEFQGEQHDKPVDFWGGIEGFKILQSHDQKKKEYCLKHNIPLIILPYKVYNEGIVINDLLIKTSKYVYRGESLDQ